MIVNEISPLFLEVKFFQKNYSFEKITTEDLIFVQNRLNMRPRKALNYKTPLEIFLNIKVALGT